MQQYELVVNDSWIRLVHSAVSNSLETWPGGDPSEQVALMTLKTDLDRLMLEVSFNEAMGT
tara:strand:- start:430 stop:612 length:183 start_codon:yes stop_codon:yes gene_type:complete